MNQNKEEEILVKSILAGSRKAFERLLMKYEGLVLHIVTPMVGVNEDREDICQDVFLKVYENLAGFQFRSKLSTWIGNIAFNTTINFLRRKRTIPENFILSGEEEENMGTAHTEINVENIPDEMLVKKEEVNRLMDAIHQLPPVQKTMLLLFHKGALSLEEISEVTEMPVNTIKSHLFRARNTLKTILQKK